MKSKWVYYLIAVVSAVVGWYSGNEAERILDDPIQYQDGIHIKNLSDKEMEGYLSLVPGEETKNFSIFIDKRSGAYLPINEGVWVHLKLKARGNQK